MQSSSLGGLRREANSQTPVAISIPAAVSESATLTPAEQRFLSYLAPHMERNWRSFLSVYSSASAFSAMCLACVGSMLSALSLGSFLSGASVGSMLSFASVGSFMSIGCVGGYMQVCW